MQYEYFGTGMFMLWHRKLCSHAANEVSLKYNLGSST